MECASSTQVINVNESNDCVDDEEEYVDGLKDPIYAPLPILTMLYIPTLFLQVKMWQDKLLEIFPHLKITVAKKADSIYPIVSAASICAKVSRDEALNAWTFPEQLQVSEEGYGSGYPNDPVTKTFLSKNIDLVFGFPQLVRFSWSTADRLLQDNAAKVEWEEEEEGNCTSNNMAITAFFKVSHSTNNKNKHGFFQQRNLTNMKSFE
uniref:Ribonuclease n=1 Tax=Timema monikensis TaxID=170555 RepID=A0A7R9HU87_9NEOP|nr:unnamed protein product [Timema monikensis]